jgi:hypothetical protein
MPGLGLALGEGLGVGVCARNSAPPMLKRKRVSRPTLICFIRRNECRDELLAVRKRKVVLSPSFVIIVK